MNRSTTSRIAASLLAIGALAGAGGAKAHGADIHVSIGAARPAVVHVPAQPVYVPAPPAAHMPVGHPVYGPPHGHEGPRAQCRAPRWNPHVRYLPGQVVRRHGDLWVARRVSARVWNENSPPEWTPQYWSPAVCG